MLLSDLVSGSEKNLLPGCLDQDLIYLLCSLQYSLAAAKEGKRLMRMTFLQKFPMMIVIWTGLKPMLSAEKLAGDQIQCLVAVLVCHLGLWK